MRRYFGTDGIRGRVGEGPMQADFILRLGRAAGRVLCPDGGTVAIGKDTRLSGYLFEAALEAGFSSAGVDVLMLGPLPTPGIAHLVQALGADAGVVISASHNPYEDNGIKFFSDRGTKLPDAQEAAIEAELEREFTTVPAAQLGRARRIDDAVARYAGFCRQCAGELSLDGLKLVLDCAHGATYRVAPQVFAGLGAQVESIGSEPDGYNINHGVGSTAPDALQAAVTASGADLGIAFDGDGDRVIMVDASGRVVDGDELLYIIAHDRQAQGRLDGPVVGTVMSNLGLERALSALGIELLRAQVGDRHVMRMLEEAGGTIGGESSGHLICLDRATTGDGIVAALQVLAALQRSGASLESLAAGVAKLPQRMINVRVGDEARLDGDARFADAIAATEAGLDGRGRVLLRASGTEPVIRVMVEGEDRAEIDQACRALADEVARLAGSGDTL